ncbi:MAG: V-type ATPase subunit [Promethearchaeota archaeon]
MRVAVESYAYTIIKVSGLVKIMITPEEFHRLSNIKEIKPLLIELERYYPTISKIKEPTLENIERKLFSIYFKFLEKIMISSPPIEMQDFITKLLYRFEIWNIKTLISGFIAGLDKSLIEEEILKEPERIIQHEDFLNDLLSANSLNELIQVLKKSIYGKAVERGYYYFQQTKEIFLLEALLDKRYYELLLRTGVSFSGKGEGNLFDVYINNMIDKYNLILIFRSLKTNVPKDLVKQLVIDRSFLVPRDVLIKLINAKTLKEFKEIILEFCDKKLELRGLRDRITEKDAISPIISILNRQIRSISPGHQLELSIRSMAVNRILNYVFNKEVELFKVLSLFVKILHRIET